MNDNSGVPENQWGRPEKKFISRKGMDRKDLRPDSSIMDFFAKLKCLLKDRQWSQADLARASGVADSTVSGWIKGKIKGKPDLDTGLKLARAFDVSLDYLADDSLDRPEPGLSEEEKELLRIGRRVGISAAIDRILVAHEIVPLGETWGQRRRPNGKDGSGDDVS